MTPTDRRLLISSDYCPITQLESSDMPTSIAISPLRIGAGFTLVELMVAMGIALLLIGGIMQIAISSRAAYQETQRLTTLQDNMWFATDFMARDLRGAEAVAFDSTEGKLTVTRDRPLRWCGVPLGTDNVTYRITEGALRCQNQEIIDGLDPNYSADWVVLNDANHPTFVTITLPLVVFDDVVRELHFTVALRNAILTRYNNERL